MVHTGCRTARGYFPCLRAITGLNPLDSLWRWTGILRWERKGTQSYGTMFPEVIHGYLERHLDGGKFEGAYPLVLSAKSAGQNVPLCIAFVFARLWDVRDNVPYLVGVPYDRGGAFRKAQSVPQTPCIALLNTPVPGLPKCLQCLIFFILLGAKMTLAKSWKQPMVSLAQARKKVIWILLNENLVSILQDTVKKSEQIWEPWATSLVR